MVEKLELDAEIIAAINNGQKVQAIKLLRQSRGIGLAEAKDFVDAYMRENNIVQPEKITASGFWIMLMVAAAVAIYLFVK